MESRARPLRCPSREGLKLQLPGWGFIHSVGERGGGVEDPGPSQSGTLDLLPEPREDFSASSRKNSRALVKIFGHGRNT